MSPFSSFAIISLGKFCNHLAREEGAGWFSFIVFLMICGCYTIVLCLFFMVSWVVLQCVVVAFPGHTLLHFLPWYMYSK